MNLPVDTCVDLFLKGAYLSDETASSLENDQDPSHKIENSLQLLGYFETRHLDNRAIEQKRANILIFLIKEDPTHQFWKSGLGIVWMTHSKKVYNTVKQTWLDQIKMNADNAQIILNAAFRLSFSELQASRDLLARAVQIDAHHQDLKGVQERINSAEKIKAHFAGEHLNS